MKLREIATGALLAVVGLGAAVAVGLAANAISGDNVGLSAEPLSAGDSLAPAREERRAARPEGTRREARAEGTRRRERRRESGSGDRSGTTPDRSTTSSGRGSGDSSDRGRAEDSGRDRSGSDDSSGSGSDDSGRSGSGSSDGGGSNSGSDRGADD